MALNQEALEAVLAGLPDDLGLAHTRDVLDDEPAEPDPAPEPVLSATPAPVAVAEPPVAEPPAAPAPSIADLQALLAKEQEKRDAGRAREMELQRAREAAAAETREAVRRELVAQLIRDPIALAREAGVDPQYFAKRTALGALGDNAPPEFRQDVVNHRHELEIAELRQLLQAQVRAAEVAARTAQRERALETVPTRADLTPALRHLASVNPDWLRGELALAARQSPEATAEDLVASLEERLAPLVARLQPIPAAPAATPAGSPPAATAAPVSTPAALPAQTAADKTPPVTSGGSARPASSVATSPEDRVRLAHEAAMRELLRPLSD